MAAFIKGKELCRGFFEQVAKPILDRRFPGLEYSAGLLSPSRWLRVRTHSSGDIFGISRRWHSLAWARRALIRVWLRRSAIPICSRRKSCSEPLSKRCSVGQRVRSAK